MSLGNSNDSSQPSTNPLGGPTSWASQLRGDRNLAFQARSNTGGPFGADAEAKIFSTFSNNGQIFPGIPNATALGLSPSVVPPAVNANDFALPISAGFPRDRTNIIEGPYTFWRTNTGVAYVQTAQPIAGLSNEAGVTRLRTQQARNARAKPKFISRLWP